MLTTQYMVIISKSGHACKLTRPCAMAFTAVTNSSCSTRVSIFSYHASKTLLKLSHKYAKYCKSGICHVDVVAWYHKWRFMASFLASRKQAIHLLFLPFDLTSCWCTQSVKLSPFQHALYRALPTYQSSSPTSHCLFAQLYDTLAGEQDDNGSAKADAAIGDRSQQAVNFSLTDSQAAATAAQVQHDSAQHRHVLHSAHAETTVHHKPMGSSDSCSEAADTALREGKVTTAGSQETAMPADGNRAGQQEQASAVENTSSTASGELDAGMSDDSSMRPAEFLEADARAASGGRFDAAVPVENSQGE